MSRTTRKRPYPFEESMEVCLEGETDKHIIGQLKAQFMNDSYYGHSVSKDFRKYINCKRRNLDKRVLHREINNEFHFECFSKWNCKDNEHLLYF